MLQAQGAAPRSYSYDANGNRTSSDASPYVLAVDSNRLLQGSARVYDYDLAGNPLSDGRYSYTYDSQGRLTEVRQGATVRQRNSYNALGQRVRKETAGGSETAPTITHALYSTEGQLLVELDANGNTLREYLYLQSWPVAVVDYAAPVAPAAAGDELTTDSVEEYPEAAESPSVDNPASSEKPVATTRPPASVDGRAVTTTPVLTYLHPDHLGTPRLATDSAKRVVWRWDSAPFGDTSPAADPDGDGLLFTLNLRFPGQYFDAETGLHYNYYRDYDPVTGRYLESDPIGLRGGVGTYGYVLANALRYVDPEGLDVTVCLYTEMAFGMGHVGFGVNSNSCDTEGFYPNSPYGAFMGRGVIKGDDPTKTKICKKIVTTPEQDCCMNRCRSERSNNPGWYHLTKRQCTSFVRDCMRDCKISTGIDPFGDIWQGPRPPRFFYPLPGDVIACPDAPKKPCNKKECEQE